MTTRDRRPAQPPEGYRLPIPARVRRAAVERQGGLCAACGLPLPERGYHCDHRPALTARGWDGKDTVPPANDPQHIEAVHAACHMARTIGDVRQMHKTKRLQAAQDAHDAAMAGAGRPQKAGRWPSGKLRSRNTLRRRP